MRIVCKTNSKPVGRVPMEPSFRFRFLVGSLVCAAFQPDSLVWGFSQSIRSSKVHSLTRLSSVALFGQMTSINSLS